MYLTEHSINLSNITFQLTLVTSREKIIEQEYPKYELEGLNEIISIPKLNIYKQNLHWPPTFYGVALYSTLEMNQYLMENGKSDLDYKDEVGLDLIQLITRKKDQDLCYLYRSFVDHQNINEYMNFLYRIKKKIQPITKSLYLIENGIYDKKFQLLEKIDYIKYDHVYLKDEKSFYYFVNNEIYLFDLTTKKTILIDKDEDVKNYYYNNGMFYKKLSMKFLEFNPETNENNQIDQNFTQFFPCDHYLIFLILNKNRHKLILKSIYNLEIDIDNDIHHLTNISETSFVIIRDQYLIYSSNVITCYRFNSEEIQNIELVFEPEIEVFENMYNFKIVKINDELIMIYRNDELFICYFKVNMNNIELFIKSKCKIHTMFWEKMTNLIYQDSLERLVIYDKEYSFVYQLKKKEIFKENKMEDIFFKFN